MVLAHLSPRFGGAVRNATHTLTISPSAQATTETKTELNSLLTKKKPENSPRYLKIVNLRIKMFATSGEMCFVKLFFFYTSL